MQKFIKKIRKTIEHFDKSTSTEVYELAIIKYMLIELSKICSRDDRFFLYKEDLLKRRKIYNRKLQLNKSNIKVSCKSYNLLIKNILKKLGIKIDLFSLGKDEFKHYALIYEHKNAKYYIDPLHDLVNLKIGADTEYFGVECKKCSNFTILTKEQACEINKIIKFENLYCGLLREVNKNIYTYDKIKSIIEYSNLNSVADLIILLNKVFTDINHIPQPNISYCITSERVTIKNIKLKKHTCGLHITDNKKQIYYFHSKHQLFETDANLKNVFIRPKFKIMLYQYFKSKNANRQIIDNVYFQQKFYELEQQLKITENDVEITENSIHVKPLDLEFFIFKNKCLGIKDKGNVLRVIVKNFGETIIVR